MKHLADAEGGWTDRILGITPSETAFDDYMASFVLSEDETLAGVLLQYTEACARADTVTGEINDLGVAYRFPRRLGFLIPRTARFGGSSSTSSKKPRVMPGMPTSSARRSTDVERSTHGRSGGMPPTGGSNRGGQRTDRPAG